MNQPIIKQYLQNLEKAGAGSILDRAVVKATKLAIGNSKNVEANVSSENLEHYLTENIKNSVAGKKMTQQEIADQKFILDEMLKYAKMADYAFKLTQATNFDTSSFASAIQIDRKDVVLN
ncbi:hypothetical protein, partial [Salinisphaera sp. Q1T1-3]|uniref:hypothetical protein n=1 Tax=Salinisphaera sp. Q1T1-3 TaxID=2321229 RepID=UPI0011C4A436